MPLSVQSYFQQLWGPLAFFTEQLCQGFPGPQSCFWVGTPSWSKHERKCYDLQQGEVFQQNLPNKQRAWEQRHALYSLNINTLPWSEWFCLACLLGYAVIPHQFARQCRCPAMERVTTHCWSNQPHAQCSNVTY